MIDKENLSKLRAEFDYLQGTREGVKLLARVFAILTSMMVVLVPTMNSQEISGYRELVGLLLLSGLTIGSYTSLFLHRHDGRHLIQDIENLQQGLSE